MAELPREASPSSPPYTVLIVEDDPGMRETFTAVLEADYAVLAAATAPEANALLEQHPVAVVLADQRLAGPTGVEFLTTVREAYPEVVRLLTTAYKDLDVAIDAINRGEVYRYLEKPMRPRELRAAVAAAVERHEAARARSRPPIARAAAREDPERMVRERTSALVQALGEAREQTARQVAVGRLARAMGSSLDPREVCRKVVEAAVELLAAPLARLWTLEATEGPFRLTASAGTAELQAVPREEIALGNGFVSTVARAREAVPLVPIAGDPRYSAQAWAAAQGLAGIVGVPVCYADQLLGVLTVSWRLRRDFRAGELAAVQALADQAALALVNARLFESVARAKREWERTFDAATDLIALLDQAGRIIRVNRAFSARLGQSPAACVGHLAHRLIGWDPFLVQGLAAKVFDRGEVAEAEGDLPILGGSFHLSAAPVPGEAGRRDRAVLVLRDITEQRRLRESEEARRRAEALSRHTSASLAHMSHELRGPLHTILGFTEILQSRSAGVPGSEEGEFLGEIRGSAEHLLALVNDFLDVAKAAANRLTIEPERCAVLPLLESVIRELAPQAGAKGLALTLKVPDELGDLWGDPVRIHQILRNLLTNAVKFTPSGGAVHVSAWVRADAVEVRVQDTGIGVAPEDHARIFEPFQQIRVPGVEPQEGTGLGLTLTKQLVELHGGRLWVESAGRGQGATFAFTVPRSPAPPRRRILLVEDEPALRALVREHLGTSGYRIEEADRGDEALAAVAARPPDLVILDVGLPGLDGRQVLIRLRADPATAKIPVVILTGLAGVPAEEFLALGANEFLTKPFSLTVLGQVVSLLLGRP